jgi:ABC-type transport system involved in Fe-S cluster assembly fused permease/ATPase subunit
MVFMTGLFVTCFNAAWQVANDQQEVGKFVILITYMSQLQSPLNFFAAFYRMIQSAIINSERMLELSKKQPIVVDNEDAVELLSCQDQLRFQDVHFSYD